MRKGQGRIGKRLKEQFLRQLEETGNVTATAKSIGISVSGAYALRQRDEQFAQDWQDAERAFLEGVKDQVYEWSTKGWMEIKEKRIGNSVASREITRKLSPQLALRVLERRHPDFRPTGELDVNMPQGVLIIPAPMNDVDEWERAFGGRGSDNKGD